MIFAARSLFFLVSLALLVIEPVSSFVCRSRSITVQSIHLSRSLVLHSNPYPWEESTPTEDGDEETLLRLRLSLKPNISMDEALNKVQAYTQSFPFAAVLPVQPLQYLPTHDGGVDVLFLRKKTAEKGSVDGGVRFFVVSGHDGINVLVKRNSQGQVIPKTFSEKQIVQAYVKGISGEDEDRSGMAPTEAVAIESVFHKWL